MILGRKIQGDKLEKTLILVLLISLYVSGLIFLGAYIFWPRSTPVDERPVIVNENIVNTNPYTLSGIYSLNVDERYYDVYLPILQSLYINKNIEIYEESFILEDEILTLQARSIPAMYDIELLEKGVREILGEDVENYGVYFYDLTRNVSFGINEKKLFPPMSISKMPVGLMMMIEIDKGNYSLDQYFTFDSQSWADPTNVLGREFIGTSFPLRDYLRFLIVDSDNSSIRMLENIMGGYLVTNEKAKNELGVEYFFRNPHDATAFDVGKVFKGIYNEEYLSTENNNYFINLLQRTHWSLQDGIPVGVPEPYKSQIAHKTGQGSSEPGYIWEDSGIVYGKYSDYVLVILNEKIDIYVARLNIQNLSRLIWDTTQN